MRRVRIYCEDAIKRGLCGLILSFVLAAPTWAQLITGTPGDDSSSGSRPRQYLLGDWGGARTSLGEKGITFDFFYMTDVQGNPTGGLRQGYADWQRIRGTVDINFDRLIQWQGLSFHATGLWQEGGNLGAKIGAIANPSSLVSANTARLDSFWVQQLFLKEKLRIRAGQMAGLDFYGNQEYGATFLLEPLGYAFGNLFSNVYEPFNPAGTPGAEIQFAPTRKIYAKGAVMSGNRDPYRQDPTGFHFKLRDNPDFLFETGYLVHPQDAMARSSERKSYPGIYKFGAVYNGGRFQDAVGRQSSGNYLIYGMASQALLRTESRSDRGLDATLGFDWSPGDVNRQNTQITAGARFNAPVARRKTDHVAAGFVYSKISDPFQRFGDLFGFSPLGSEKAFEVTYGFQLTPYILLEPTFQYYIDTGANRTIPNPAVFGLRTKIKL